jgi:hypothetical protein
LLGLEDKTSLLVFILATTTLSIKNLLKNNPSLLLTIPLFMLQSKLLKKKAFFLRKEELMTYFSEL